MKRIILIMSLLLLAAAACFPGCTGDLDTSDNPFYEKVQESSGIITGTGFQHSNLEGYELFTAIPQKYFSQQELSRDDFVYMEQKGNLIVFVYANGGYETFIAAKFFSDVSSEYKDAQELGFMSGGGKVAYKLYDPFTGQSRSQPLESYPAFDDNGNVIQKYSENW
jgi:hypothetical protein